ncbi:MAG: hypothetical protein ACRDIB_05065 [Ardenticatenaceae bacterium]
MVLKWGGATTDSSRLFLYQGGLMGHYAIVQVINQWIVKVVSTAEFLQERSAREWARRRHVDGNRLQLVSAPEPIAVPVGKPIRRPDDWTHIAD